MTATSRKQPFAAAAALLLLIFPAALFIAALAVRGFQPIQYEPAHTAQNIVMWYSGKGWALWILLVALPLAVLAAGCVTLFSRWSEGMQQVLAAVRAHLATIVVAAATLAAAGILAIVALHILAD